MRRKEGTWMGAGFALVVLFAATGTALGSVDLVCPLCEEEGGLGVAGLVDLALATMIQKGISILLLGALAVVGLPWLVAGVAVAAFQLPEKLRGR